MVHSGADGSGGEGEAAARRSAPRRRRRLGRWRVPLLIVMALLAVVIADVLGTAVLKLAGIHKTYAEAEAGYRRPHPVFDHGFAPNTSTQEATWGYLRHEVHVNSLGMKDASVREVPAKAPGTRVLFAGDSFTEGIGCAYEDTFVGRLAAAWAPRGIDVLNLGCSSYSPIIYWRKVRWLVEEQHVSFDRLVVCLDMSDIINEATSYQLGEDGNVHQQVRGVSSRWKLFLSEHTILLNAIRTMIHDLRHAVRDGINVVDHECSSWSFDEALWQRHGERGIAGCDHYLTLLRDYVAALGVPMTLVVYPWPDQVRRHEVDCRQRTYWAEWCARHGVQFVDLFPAFLDAGPAEQVLRDCFIKEDMHWNPRGHEVVARELLEALTF
ncbi:MAG: GDSL-type esterase/lipase family protein [Planctomycetota bacterium]